MPHGDGGVVVGSGTGGLSVGAGLVLVAGGLDDAPAATSIVIDAPGGAFDPGFGLMLNTVPGVVPAGALPTVGWTVKPWPCSS